MKTGLFILFAGIIYILLNDSLLYLSIKRYLRTRLFRGIFWLHTLLFVAGFVVYHFLMPRLKGPDTYYWIGEGISVFLLFYVPKTCYLLLQGIALLLKKFTGSTKVSRILQYTAVCVSVFFFGLILYGISWGRSDYKVEQVDVVIPDLPDSFNGLRVVQLTDLHLGSCGKSFKGIAKLVERVNALNPDLIVFTGDMVNNFAEELEPWIEKLRGLHAPLGVYAVTGNHDYGKYTRWESEAAEKENLKRFFENMEKAGFRMLNNANVPLVEGQDTVFLCGVENWGLLPFPQIGDLQQALEGTEGHVVILLSHDPSHWRQEVVNYPVALTLSGHTHAMQMGIRIGHFQWSPSQYIYREYNGLYHENGHQLYVSRGAGFIGIAGRIAQRPEITLLKLNNRQ